MYRNLKKYTAKLCQTTNRRIHVRKIYTISSHKFNNTINTVQAVINDDTLVHTLMEEVHI